MTDNSSSTWEIPVLLIVTGESDRGQQLRSALVDEGWQVRVVKICEEAPIVAGTEPISLVLLDLGSVGNGGALTRLIRSIASPSAAAPIICIGSSKDEDDAPEWSQVDALLPGGKEIDSLVRSLETWRPVSLAPTRRIAAMFGAGPIAGMIERLARRLEAAMADLDGGAIDKAQAHRLAGLCGTLGFGQAHAAWLDLSLGDTSAISEVRRTTRLTLSAIAQGL